MTGDSNLKEIQDEVIALGKRLELAPDRAFVVWFLMEVLGYDESTAREAAAVGNGDRGVDACILDEEAKVLWLVSAKYTDKPKGESYGREVITDLASVPKRLDTLEGKQKPQIARTADDYIDAKYKGFTVNLVVAILGELTPDAKKEVGITKMPENHYLMVFDAKKMADTTKKGATKPVLLKPTSQVIERKDPPAIVFSVKGRDLARSVDGLGYSAFESNPRYFIGGTKVNRGITATLEDKTKRKLFWYFNNGITALCEKFEKAGDDWKIYNLRIVNGCQTTKTMMELMHSLDDSVEVLIRVVQSDSTEFSHEVSTFTNQQNRITPKDQVSRDETQRKLQQALLGIKPGFYLEIKRRGWKEELDDSKRKKLRNIDNETAARCVVALKGSPKESLRISKEDLFDPLGEVYKDVFSSKEAHRLLAAWLINEALLSAVEDLKKRLKTGKVSKEEREVFQLCSSRIFLRHVLTFFGTLIKSAHLDETWDQICMDPIKFEEKCKALAHDVLLAMRTPLFMKAHKDKYDLQDDFNYKEFLFNTDPTVLLEERKRVFDVTGAPDPLLPRLP